MTRVKWVPIAYIVCCMLATRTVGDSLLILCSGHDLECGTDINIKHVLHGLTDLYHATCQLVWITGHQENQKKPY
jgi:hypothetical protein